MNTEPVSLSKLMQLASHAAGAAGHEAPEFSERARYFVTHEPQNLEEMHESCWLTQEIANSIAFYHGKLSKPNNADVVLQFTVDELQKELKLRTEDVAHWKSKYELAHAELDADDTDSDSDFYETTTPTKARGSPVCPPAPQKGPAPDRASASSSAARELFPSDAKREAVSKDDLLHRYVHDATPEELEIALANAYADHECTCDQLDEARVEINRLKTVVELDRRNRQRLERDLSAQKLKVRTLVGRLRTATDGYVTELQAEKRAIQAYHDGLLHASDQHQPGVVGDDWDFVDDSLDDDDNPSGAPCVRAIATERPRTTSTNVDEISKERTKNSRQLELKIQNKSAHTPMESPFKAVAPDEMVKDLVLPKNDPQWERWEDMIRHAPSIWCRRLMSKPVQYHVSFKVATNGKKLSVDTLNSSASEEDRRMVAKYGDRFWQVSTGHSVSVWQLDVYREA